MSVSEEATTTLTRGGHVASGVALQRRSNVELLSSKKATRTRGHILNAARVVFARLGYLDTTVEHVVSEAGVSRGSFYTYFASKQEIFRHLAAMIDRQIEEQVITFERSNDGNPITNLEKSNKAYVAVVQKNADLYRLVEQVAAFDTSVRESRVLSRQQHIIRVAASIRRWQLSGWADPKVNPDIASATLVAMLSGFAQWLPDAPSAISESEAVDYLNAVWVKACGLSEPKQ